MAVVASAFGHLLHDRLRALFWKRYLPERNQAIRRMRAGGATREDTARYFGLSSRWIRHIEGQTAPGEPGTGGG